MRPAPGMLAIFAAVLLLGGAPAGAQTTGAPPVPGNAQSRPDKLQPGDAFGEEVTLTEKSIVYFSGSGTWDNAFETIVDGFKTVNAFLEKQGIKPAGPPMTIYTATTDASFEFQAAIPIAQPPKDPPQGDIAVGTSPSGKAYKFIHRGSYDAMDTTYDAITNFLDEKRIDAKDLFIELYLTDPVTTPEEKLVVEVYVPVK